MMKKAPAILEIIVCSLADALAAAQGGATRLEVISRFDLGGLTPTLQLVREIAGAVKLPLRVMLRESVGFEVNDEAERRRLCAKARELSELAVDGLVLGFLRNRRIDEPLLEDILSCAPNLRATFHRAFEELQDPIEAIARLKKYPQVDCILTSGGAAEWSQKLELLAQCKAAASPEISILVGGGVDFQAIELLQKSTGIRAFHMGRAVRVPAEADGRVDVARVSRVARLTESL
jgi:copper homeostasis protein